MLGKSDSGYSETDERQSRCSDQDYLISTESALGVELQMRLDSGANRVGKCLRVSTDLITPPQLDVAVSDSNKSRMTGSSCQALRHAVAALNRLDDFTSEKIGSGFFSEVFKVTHRTTGQVMVLKMNLLRSNRPNMLKEVQLMNQLSHPNILGFMGVCVHEGQLHALTEYINGGSLEQLNLSRTVQLPHRTRMRLAQDIARGVEYLHSRGVFHRDLTSKNVLIKKNEETGEMTAVVGDFGLAAKIPDPKSGYRLPTVGSPYWMSPECLKGQWYDERSDVFSYGIVLCELIARCEADPDVLPRTENFGLDYLAFADMCGPCPADFLKLAFLCCTFEPKSRPSFSEIVSRLVSIVSAPDDPDSAPEDPAPPPPKLAASLGARSEEVLPGAAGAAVGARDAAHHKKLAHRRSLSDDAGSLVFPPHTAPSDKARCHFLPCRPPPPPPPLSAKHVGESMLAQDPHYRPAHKANPFAALTHFRGVKKIVGTFASPGDLFSSCLELPSPFEGSLGDLTLCREEGEEGGVGHDQADRVSETTECSADVTKCDSDGSKCGSDRFKCSSDTLMCNLEESKFSLEASKCNSDTSKFSSDTSKCNSDSFKCSSDTLICNSEASKCNSEASKFSSDALKCFSVTSKCTLDTLKCSSGLSTCISVADTKRSPSGSSAPAKPMSLPSSPTTLRRRLPSPPSTPNLADACYTGDLAKRRGSCESGFFSSIGDDFALNAVDLLSPDFVTSRARGSPSAALSSSSVFLLDDSVTTASSVRSSELGDLDELSGAVGLCRTHHSLLFAAKRSSSIFTDSSEDISSLGGGDLYWEELSGALGPPPPHQISKMVEYFERNARNGADVWDLGLAARLKTSAASPVEFARRMEGATLNEAARTNRIAALRRRLERPVVPVVATVQPVVTVTGAVRRAVNATQRLMICEGAVKSKLPLFDKKS